MSHTETPEVAEPGQGARCPWCLVCSSGRWDLFSVKQNKGQITDHVTDHGDCLRRKGHRAHSAGPATGLHASSLGVFLPRAVSTQRPRAYGLGGVEGAGPCSPASTPRHTHATAATAASRLQASLGTRSREPGRGRQLCAWPRGGGVPNDPGL